MADSYRTYYGGGVGNADTTTGGPGGLINLYNTMNSAGAGDNSANVATLKTHLLTMFGTTHTTHTPVVSVNVDITKVTTVSQLRAILKGILDQAASDLGP